MKKLVYCFGLMLIVSCSSKNATNISPDIIQQLFEKTYLDSTIKVAGYTMHTYINQAIQQTTKDALTKSLMENNADYGLAIVMETKSGKINAFVNLEKDKLGHYLASKSCIVSEPIELGGLIKTFDVMSLLEDKKADTATVYDAHGGEISYGNQKIYDNHLGMHKLSLSDAYAHASNTIFAQAIDSAYSKNPISFINNLSKFGLCNELELPIPQSNRMHIPNPQTSSWTNTTLPLMAIGYELSISPIQIITYYNAIANNGVMVQPLFISHIQHKSGEQKEYRTKVLNKAICSRNTIYTLQNLMNKVITQGTGKSLFSDKIEISGKSATIKIGTDSNTKYAAAFVGFFPAQKPEYTVLVYVNNPKISFYGTSVAGTVLRTIATSINNIH
jgi:cell division protein FtsI (penicillin-binding protein 3)